MTDNLDSIIKQLQTELKDTDPIASTIAQRIRGMIWQVYSQIKLKAIHVSNDFLEIIINDDVFRIEHGIAAVITTYLLNRATLLLIGGPGSGKTSLSRSISRMMTGSSIEEMENIIHIDAEIEKEDWLGEKDPRNIIGHVDTMDWIIHWKRWIERKKFESDNGSISGALDVILDEINRGSRRFQNQWLSILADGRCQYSDYFKTLPELRVFMTINPMDDEDIQSNRLDYAFLDRVTHSVRVPQADRRAMSQYAKCRRDERSLGYSDDAMIDVVFTDVNDLRRAAILTEKIPIDVDADRLAVYLARESSLCVRAPSFDKSMLDKVDIGPQLCSGCHLAGKTKQICYMIKGGSMRAYKDLISLGRAYAFWIGLPSVTKYIIYAIAPDVLGHRLLPVSAELNKDVSSYGDTRTFIKRNYVDFCWENIELRQDIEEKTQNLLDGVCVDPDKDFNDVLTFANNDIYARADMLPLISVGDNLAQNLTYYKPTYTCKDANYITDMQKARDAAQKQDMHALKTVLENLSNTPLRSRIQDYIFGVIHNLSIQVQRQRIDITADRMKRQKNQKR